MALIVFITLDFQGVHILFPLVFFLGGYEFDRFRWGDNKNAFLDLKGLRRYTFIQTFFRVFGHLSKADGRVSTDEIKVAINLMHELKLDKAEYNIAKKAFNFGKEDVFPLSITLNEFYNNFRINKAVTQQFMQHLIEGAIAGDTITPHINSILFAVAAQLDVSDDALKRIYSDINRHETKTKLRRKHKSGEYIFQSKYTQNKNNQKEKQQSPKRHYVSAEILYAYETLGVSNADDNDSVKRAYRLLLSKCHPDKVIANGASEEEQEIAHDRTIEIRQAYEKIKAIRKF